jgi:hypothetical protein
VVKSTKNRITDLKSKEVVRMGTRESLIEKIKSLPEDRLGDVANFVESLETKGKREFELAEYGMGDYLAQLLAYEDMLAAGKVKWR